MRPRRRTAVMVTAVLAALVAFLQLPGPANCPNLSWRWVALSLEGLEAEPPDKPSATSDDAAAVVQVDQLTSRCPGQWCGMPTPAPPHARIAAVVDAGVTRAPPVA